MCEIPARHHNGVPEAILRRKDNMTTKTKAPATPYDKLTLPELIVKIADDRKAADIIQMDVRDLTILADDLIILTGTSAPHLRAIADRIDRDVREQRGIRPRTIDGTPASGWVLMDYSDVIVHILTEEVRHHYDLEHLWADAPRVETLKKLQKLQDKIRADGEAKIAAALARTSLKKPAAKAPAKTTTAKTATKTTAKKSAVAKPAVKKAAAPKKTATKTPVKKTVKKTVKG